MDDSIVQVLTAIGNALNGVDFTTLFMDIYKIFQGFADFISSIWNSA